MARQKNAKSTHCTDFATLWKIFLDMVRQYPTRIIVFVDALDECTVQRSDFLNALTPLPAGVDVRFCVTSRNFPDIKKAFAEYLDHSAAAVDASTCKTPIVKAESSSAISGVSRPAVNQCVAALTSTAHVSNPAGRQTLHPHQRQSTQQS